MTGEPSYPTVIPLNTPHLDEIGVIDYEMRSETVQYQGPTRIWKYSQMASRNTNLANGVIIHQYCT